MANEIVWYHSDEAGAPVLNNAAGSLDAVLYACLVTGFRPQTLTSVTVTANVATAVLAGHGYDDQKMLDIGGAATGAINGRKLITKTGSGTFTFPAPGVADGAVGGVITAKRSPLGWTRDANSGSVSIYKRSDVTANAMGLRIDDSGTSPINARALTLETWVDTATYGAQAPTAAQLSGGGYISKGANTAAAKKWLLVGDSKFFYLFTESSSSPFSSTAALMPYGWGDPVTYRSPDPFGTLAMFGGSSDTYGGMQSPVSANGASGSGSGDVWARQSTQIGVAIRARTIGLSNTNLGRVSPAYPSPVDNGFVAHGPLFVNEDVGSFGYPIRGHLPGLYEPLCTGLGVMHANVLDGVVGMPGKTLVVATGQGTVGAALFDITGPWR